VVAELRGHRGRAPVAAVAEDHRGHGLLDRLAARTLGRLQVGDEQGLRGQFLHSADHVELPVCDDLLCG
jgi:hypothetical protein